MDCHWPSSDSMNECKPKVLELIEKALAKHQICTIVARLHNARNLEWEDQKPLGLELVREFQQQSTSRAWPWRIEPYSPLELISHPPNREVNEADIELWNVCRRKAEAQIKSVEVYLPPADLSGVRGLLDACDQIRPSSEKLKVINDFKNALRWSPKSVLENLGIQDGTKHDFGDLPIGCYAIIAGSEERICLGVEHFIADLRDHRCLGQIVYGYAAEDDRRERNKPRLLWMALWGEKAPDSKWPPVGGNKIMDGLKALKGTLACYHIELSGNEFHPDLLTSSSELARPDKEFCQMSICMERNRTAKEPLIGFAFVLQGYPKCTYS